MVEIKIDVDTHGLDDKLEKHASLVAPKLRFLLSEITLFGQNRVKALAPRGKRCPGSPGSGQGRLKASIQREVDSDSGHIWTDDGVAPYNKYVIEGRGEVRPVKAKALRFCVDGREVFSKRSGPSEANDFFKKALPMIKTHTKMKVGEFERWVVDL